MKKAARVRAKAESMRRVSVGIHAHQALIRSIDYPLAPLPDPDVGPGDWERRLRNWALWVISGDAGSGYCSSVYQQLDMMRRRPGNIMPILSIEARDTDDLVGKLEEYLRAAVLAWYVTNVHNETRQERMRRAGCDCESTFRNRIRSAKCALQTLDTARNKARRPI